MKPSNETESVPNGGRVIDPDGDSPDDRAFAHLRQGALLEGESDWTSAAESYRRCLGEVPGHPYVGYFGNNNLGYCLIQLGAFDDAEPYCAAAIEIDPRRHNAHKNLGLVYQGQGRWLDAALCFIEATQRCPEDPRAFRHLEQLVAARPELERKSAELRETINALRQASHDRASFH